MITQDERQQFTTVLAGALIFAHVIREGLPVNGSDQGDDIIRRSLSLANRILDVAEKQDRKHG